MSDILNSDGSVIEDQGLVQPVPTPEVTPLPLSGEATADEIAQWKAKNPRGVWEIKVGDKLGYLRKPTRDEMKSVATMGQTDPIGQVEALMRDSWLGGDEAILNDDDYFLGASSTYQELITIRTAELKKL